MIQLIYSLVFQDYRINQISLIQENEDHSLIQENEDQVVLILTFNQVVALVDLEVSQVDLEVVLGQEDSCE